VILIVGECLATADIDNVAAPFLLERRGLAARTALAARTLPCWAGHEPKKRQAAQPLLQLSAWFPRRCEAHHTATPPTVLVCRFRSESRHDHCEQRRINEQRAPPTTTSSNGSARTAAAGSCSAMAMISTKRSMRLSEPSSSSGTLDLQLRQGEQVIAFSPRHAVVHRPGHA